MKELQLLFEALMNEFHTIYANELWLSIITVAIPVLITLSFVVDVLNQDV